MRRRLGLVPVTTAALAYISTTSALAAPSRIAPLSRSVLPLRASSQRPSPPSAPRASSTGSMPPKKRAKTDDEGGGGEPWYRKFVGADNKGYEHYMEHEWGFELHGDEELFEMLTLEGAQAGLSWATILKKREAYRECFDQWDIEKIARYDAKKVEWLLSPESGIVRNKAKVHATIGNAQAALKAQEEFGSLDRFLWDLAGGGPVLNRIRSLSEAPCTSPVSEAMSKALKDRGFKFVGPTIMYAFMQATGMVVDHPVGTPQFRAAEQRLEGRAAGGAGKTGGVGGTRRADAKKGGKEAAKRPKRG